MPDLSGMLRILFVGLLFSFSASAQKQLVLLKNGKPVGRYVEGEYLYFIMKDGREKEGKVIELEEFFAVIVNPTAPLGVDTIHFNKIRKIQIPKEERRGLSKKFGFLLMAGGITYLGLDLINSAAGYNSAGVDKQVVTASAILIGVGSLLYFIKPKWRVVNQGTFLRTVDYKSKFYKSG